MKMSECFRRAADVVDAWQFCCHAVEQVALSENAWNVGQRCKQEIERRLEGEYTVTDWLKRRGVYIYAASREQIQDYRRRWMLALADEFEARGM